MAVEHHIDQDKKLIITTWQGEAGTASVVDAITKYQNQVQNNPICESFNELVNIQGVTGIALTPNSIRSIVQLAANSDKPNISRKLAIVVGSTFAYGIARMYQSYRSVSKNSKKQVRIFKQESEALEWLAEDPI